MMNVLRKVKTIRAWTRLLVVVATLEFHFVKSSVIHVETPNDFCNRKDTLLECTFRNTDKEVVMEHMPEGTKEVKIVSATAFRGHASCEANLEVWSSRYVTLFGNNVTTGILPGVLERRAKESDEAGISTSFNSTSPDNLLSKDILRDLITNIKSENGRSLDDSNVTQNHCVGNVSVRQSNIPYISGEFGVTTLQASKVEDLAGKFKKLEIKKSQLQNFSAVGNTVLVEGSRINKLDNLLVFEKLLVNATEFAEINEPGITLYKSLTVNTQGPQANGELQRHTITRVRVGLMVTGKLIVSSSELYMNDVTIDEIGSEAITVENGGKAVIHNLEIKQGPRNCLALRGNAQVTLYNVTLADRKISQLYMSSTNSKPLYPLLAVWPVKTGVKIRPVIETGSSRTESPNTEEFKGMEWYWIVIMAVIGLIAGIIVGTALKWRKPQKPKELSSTLTLSDLLNRDRYGEENGGGSYVLPNRPDLLRQDSGLTSSSFASYAPCSDRRAPCSMFPEEQLLDTADPNLFIHVPSSLCSREEVIYEEVEALQLPREENHYVTMKGH